MTLSDPARLVICVDSGGMEGGTGRYQKRLSELAGLYLDTAAHAASVAQSGDPVVYTVDDFRPSANAGDLIFGVTRMLPGKIGDEFYLTRGHIHAKADRPEIYHGQSGRGLMLMESPDGETRTIEIAPNAVCYVPPYWIHRSINIGSDDLVMAFSYPADAGQDYGIIARSNGMRKRVVDDARGGWMLLDNPDYRPRSADQIRHPDGGTKPMTFSPATRPTLYFIGVSTGSSSIMRVFPAWARFLGLADAVIQGIDFPLHAAPARYRDAVAFIKGDPLSLGALVTTHKIDLFAACRDLFDAIDPHADLMEETSCLSKRDGRLLCHAKDPISSGLTLDAFLPDGHFAKTGAEVFVMGAGGSAIAMTWHLMRASRGPDVPTRILVSDRGTKRLEAIRRIHAEIRTDVPCDYIDASAPGANDAALAGLKPGSLVVNATGLGKDAPGSPLTDAARFPHRGIAWDLNYRGDLVFLDQARAQQAARHLQIENGWTYFLHGWTQVIAEVFGIEIPTAGPRFGEIARIAKEA